MKEKEIYINFKEALLNPMLIFSNILDMEIEYNNVAYLLMLDRTFTELFYLVFDYDLYDKELTDILLNNKIDIVKLNHNLSGTNIVKMYNDIYILCKHDINKLRRKICYSFPEDSEVRKICFGMKRLFNHLGIDSNVIYHDIEKHNIMFTDSNIKKISDILAESIMYIIDCLMKKDKKEESKKMIENIYDEDLNKNVNKLDKNQNVKLKHPKNTIDDEYDFEELMDGYRYMFIELLCALNDIKANKFISKSKYSVFPDGVKKIKINKSFKKKSYLFDKAKYEISSSKYKRRFLTYIINWVIDHMNDIVNICYNINHDCRYLEYDMKSSYIEYTANMLFDLINNMILGKPYKEELSYFTELYIYLNMDKNVKKNVKKVNTLEKQKTLLSYRCRRFSKSSKDITIDTILKLSYLVCTNDTNVKNKFTFISGLKPRNKYEVKHQIEHLGKLIRKEQNKTGKPVLYKYFMSSIPLIYSRYRDVNENEDLRLGILALKYFEFLCNDNGITKFINKMI